MARRADLFLHPQPGHRPGLALGGHAVHLSTKGWRRQTFMDKWVNGLDEYRKSLEPFTLEVPPNGDGLVDRNAEESRPA